MAGEARERDKGRTVEDLRVAYGLQRGAWGSRWGSGGTGETGAARGRHGGGAGAGWERGMGFSDLSSSGGVWMRVYLVYEARRM